MVMDRTLTLDPTAAPDDGEPERPHLFVILECQRPRGGGARYALEGVDEVVVGRGATRSATREKEAGLTRLVLRFPDPLMSSTHAKLARGPGGAWEVTDLGSTNGTYVSGAKTERSALEDGELFELGSTLFIVRPSLPTPPDAPAVVESTSLAGRVHGFGTLLPWYSRRLRALLQVAVTDVPILLLGESGTGKEALASGIHTVSGRAGPLVAVPCGGVSEALAPSALLGHTKGAFSGAVGDEPGFIRASDKGTLLLDEIGELPRSGQAALLRALEEHAVTPVGGTQTWNVDVRVVSTARHRAGTPSAPGELRSDLCGLIAEYTHYLPALRDRKEDLGMLLGDLLERLAPGRNVRLTPALGRALYRYDWPLNLRELMDALQSAAGSAEHGALDLHHAPEALRASR